HVLARAAALRSSVGEALRCYWPRRAAGQVQPEPRGEVGPAGAPELLQKGGRGPRARRVDERPDDGRAGPHRSLLALVLDLPGEGGGGGQPTERRFVGAAHVRDLRLL